MYWLILYSQIENGRELSANTVSVLHPGDFLLNLNKEYPKNINKLLFAIEISQEQFKNLGDEI